MFQNHKKSMFYQFLFIVIASLSCLTCVPGAKNIKFYEGLDLPMEKAAVLSYNADYLVKFRLVQEDGYGYWNDNIGIADVLKTIDGKIVPAFQKGGFHFMLKPGPHMLAVDIKEVQKVELNKLKTWDNQKTRLDFHFLEDLESNNTLAFEAKEGHKYKLLLAPITAIKIKDTLYISYITTLFVFDNTENKIVSTEVPGAFSLKVQKKSIVFFDGEILPPEKSVLLQTENPNLIIREINGETADGTKLFSELPLNNVALVMKPGKYRLKAQYISGSAHSTSDAIAEFTAEAGRKYKVKYKKPDGGRWAIIIE